MLQMEYEPEGMVEKAGGMLGMAKRRVQGDLERFKELIERQGPKVVHGGVKSTSLKAEKA
jgi:hypothetical protein